MACITPIHMPKPESDFYYTFPCGKCPQCLKRRASGWSFRLMQEDKRSDFAYFVTLTYNQKNCPVSKNGFMTLDKAHIQKFMKRLRKLLPGASIKYYACGEYGGKFNRPHYHLILFNADPFSVERAWSLDSKAIGSCFFGSVTGASIGYVLKYMMKPGKIPAHSRDDRQKEFQLCSKKLGANYITDQMVAWHKADLEKRMYLNIEDGKKIAMPRYYKDKIYSEMERARISLYARNEAERRAEEYERKMVQEYGIDWIRMKVEADKYSFTKMYNDAEKGRQKAPGSDND